MSAYRYIAKGGRVYVDQAGSVREISSAITANGRDVERFHRAAVQAARQRADAFATGKAFERAHDPHPGSVEA